MRNDGDAELVENAVKRCLDAVEDGWDEDDFRYVETEIRKTASSLREKMGWPDETDTEEMIISLRSRYGASQRALDNAKEYVVSVGRGWIRRLESGGDKRNGTGGLR